jgi:peptide methionine sulfoxide reductase MsrA
MKVLLSGGCFWCVEAMFSQIKGIEKLVSGYATPLLNEQNQLKYLQKWQKIEEKYYYSSAYHNKIEVVEITYNDEISLKDILAIHYFTHNPTLTQWGKDCMFPLNRSAILFSHDNPETTQPKQTQSLIEKTSNSQMNNFDGSHVNLVVNINKDAPKTPSLQNNINHDLELAFKEELQSSFDYLKMLTDDMVFVDIINNPENKPISVEVLLPNQYKFIQAEEKEQKYYQKNPEDGYCTSIINPKISKLKKQYQHLLK